MGAQNVSMAHNAVVAFTMAGWFCNQLSCWCNFQMCFWHSLAIGTVKAMCIRLVDMAILMTNQSKPLSDIMIVNLFNLAAFTKLITVQILIHYN